MPSTERPICVRRILEIVGIEGIETLNPRTASGARTVAIHGLRCELHKRTVAFNVYTGEFPASSCPELEDEEDEPEVATKANYALTN